MKVGIAMSGGVDSTACALMLQQEYAVKGFFMRLAQPDFKEQLQRVSRVAAAINIDLEVIDLREEFEQAVLKYFSRDYFNGRTPNPCVVCNKEIKFGLFLDAVLNKNMDRMATGHYARIEQYGNLYHLKTGIDSSKDQSYFLSRLNQLQLGSVLFPLGTKVKEDIYSFVEAHGFTHFRGQESQDVCFLEKKQIGNFLEARKPESLSDGPIKKVDGTIIGRHNGLYNYTIGQRKGLGISHPTPLYVVGIDAANNTVLVGDNDQLFKKTIQIKDLHWLQDKAPDTDIEYTVRIRYSHRGSAARLNIDRGDTATIIFNEPQRAITPGQFAVIYHNSELLGSGVIM